MKLPFFSLGLFFLLSVSWIWSDGIHDASSYHKNSNLQWQWAMDALDAYPLDGSERVLDVGCGEGKITACIADRVPNGFVVGVDLSVQMINFASLAFSPERYKNLFFMQSNVTALPFRNQFHLVCSFCCLNWVPDQLLAFTKMQESLLPDGNLLIVVPAKDENNLGPLMEKLVKSDKWAFHCPAWNNSRVYFTKDEYKIFINQAGLMPLSIKENLSITLFPNRKSLIDWLKPLMNFISHLSVDLQDEFTQDLADMIIQKNPCNRDGSIPLHYMKVEIVAKKPLF